MRILVVEDEPKAGNYLLRGLDEAGYVVDLARNGVDGLHMALEMRYDAIVLDVMMPQMNGWQVMQALRMRCDTPVLFLTARDAVEDRVAGITAGGDDYVTKPFSPEEIVLRLRTILRRASGRNDGHVTYADLTLDEDAHEVRRAGTPIDMTPTEYRLLRYLLVNAGRVLTRSQILDHVWQYDFGGDGTVLETYISYLRRKIDRFDPPLIQTVRGVGYVLRPPRT